MSGIIKELSASHMRVMNLLVVGYSLKEVCDAYGLKYDSWKEITNAELFQAELKRRVEEKMERELESNPDPNLERLKKLGSQAISVLAEEMSNHDYEFDRATAQTRINAADSVLDRLNYGKQGKDTGPTIILNFSAEKMAFLQDRKQVKPAEVISGN